MKKTLKRGTREVVYKVYKRCLLEKEAGIILSDRSQVWIRTAELTDKSLSTVRRIVQEAAQNNGKFSTPVKHRAGRSKKILDDFDMCAIRQTIQHFYTVRKQVPTLRNLLPIVTEDLGYTGSRDHLRKAIKALGFKFKKWQSSRTLVEINHIAAKREEYLKIIIANRNLPEELRKEVIYLDESFIDSSYKLKKCWQSIYMYGDREEEIWKHKRQESKDKRYIIVHAGSQKGFIPNALLIFSGTNKNEASQMNQHNFTKWVKEKLIPNINKDSIVVMNNAPYHSVVRNRAPTTATKVDDIKWWLIDNNIQFDDSLRKPQLLMLVKKNKPAPIYEIDELFSEHGHTVVRLPPCHCDLNPTELIWRIAKQKMASHKVGTIDIKAAAEQAFQSISVEDWRKACERVIEIERGYYERGRTLYDDIDRLITNRQDDSSSDDSSESDDEMPAASDESAAHANGSDMEISQETTSVREDEINEIKEEIKKDEVEITSETTSVHEVEIKEEIKMDEDEIFIPSMQLPVKTEPDPLESNNQLNHVIGHDHSYDVDVSTQPLPYWTSIGESALNKKRYENMAMVLQREKAINARNRKVIRDLTQNVLMQNLVIKRLNLEIKTLKSKKS